MTLEKVPRVCAVRRYLYLVAKCLGVGPARHYFLPSLGWVVVSFHGM
jgi:hypothetical protein